MKHRNPNVSELYCRTVPYEALNFTVAFILWAVLKDPSIWQRKTLILYLFTKSWTSDVLLRNSWCWLEAATPSSQLRSPSATTGDSSATVTPAAPPWLLSALSWASSPRWPVAAALTGLHHGPLLLDQLINFFFYRRGSHLCMLTSI